MKKSAFSRLVNKYEWATPANIETARAWEKAKAATDDYIIAANIEEAWSIVKTMFPELEWKAGADEYHYRAYYKGELADYFYICILGNTLELNLPNGETFRVNYRVYSCKPLWEIEREWEQQDRELEERLNAAEVEEISMETMTKEEIIENMASDIEEALETYEANTTSSLHHGSAFVDKLAQSSYEYKETLRDIFRLHKAWNEREQRIGVNITIPQVLDKGKISRLLDELCANTVLNSYRWLSFFVGDNGDQREAVDYINETWAGVYRPDTKKTRVLSKVLKKEGLWEAKQDIFSRLSDEVNKKDISMKLYISLNPADFMTMSNPQNPVKGKAFMQSCHSLDSGCEYHCGASGYARDSVSFIVYTVAAGDEDNRWYKKTNRQMFAYHDGELLQSRLYTTFADGDSYGGVYSLGEREKNLQDVILKAVQGVFSECLKEDWGEALVSPDCLDISYGGFGGYPDWVHYPNLARVAVLEGHLFYDFMIGENAGLCLECGNEIFSKLYCEDCGDAECEECGDFLHGEGHWVTDTNGNEIQVCDSCLEDNYFYCESCGEYHHVDHEVRVNTDCGEIWVCSSCAERNYYQCEDCGEWFDRTYTATGEDGHSREVCQSCAEDNYTWCDGCNELFHYSLIEEIDGEYYCEDCAEYQKKHAEG